MQTVRVGLFFLLGLALLWVTFESLSGTGGVFKSKGYVLTARFDNLKGLSKGDDVLIAGVRVGSVTQTHLAGRQAEAVLRIDPGVRIAGDAVAMVAQSSLLGTNHLEVTVGSPEATPLEPGAEIKTRDTVDMNEVIAKLGSLGDRLEQVVGEIGKTLGGGPGGNLFAKVDKLVTDNGPKITETVSNLQDITAKIRGGEGTLGRLVNDTRLHDEMLASVDQIKAAATDARTLVSGAQSLVDQVKAGKGALGTLIYDEQTGNEIKVAAKNLRELSDKLNSGQGSLGKLIGDDSLYREAQGTLRKVDRAVDSLSDQGPITAVGVAAKALF
ncbi:MAG TPA: MlaD family protein [Opitutaceae bacterium]|nr:MlaD family protein [Opitutaceae bacterium]